MDSVITQVQRSDEIDEHDAEIKLSNVPEVTSIERTLTTSNVTVDQESKKSRSSLFRRIFCCGSCKKRKKKPISNHLQEPSVQEELLQPGENTTNGSLSILSNGNTNSGASNISVGSGNNIPISGNDGFLLQPDPTLSKPTMVIDLDETLVHSSFKPIPNADFVVPVEIDGTIHQVYVAKRPYVDEFLEKMGPLYECVLFTASLAKYADPVADLLDRWGVFKARLFREACVFHRGNYVKDLNRLGRSLQRVIIVDNSPASYIFHPDNAVPVASWFDDTTDTELLYLIPFFERLANVENVYTVLRNSNHPFNTPPTVLKDLPSSSSPLNGNGGGVLSSSSSSSS